MHSIYRLLLTLIAIISVNFVYANLKIALLTDTHVSPGSENEIKLKEAVAEINNSDCDIVVVSGDLTNTGSNEELTNVKAILDGIGKPKYIIPGNHENNWSQSAGATFKELFGDDKFEATVNDILLVGMNCGPYMKMGNGHIRREDLIWLDNVLSKSNASQVISINHYPFNEEMDMCDEYVSLLHRFPVIVHLCGHYHQFKYYNAGDIDCLINRALDMKNGDYGYSIIEVTTDSVKQWNKQLSQSPELKNGFIIKTNHPKYITETTLTSQEEISEHMTKVFTDNASIFTIPTIDKEYVYIGNGLGVVKCINIKSGVVKWQYQTKGSLYAKPIVAGKYLVVPTTDKRLLWLNKDTGKLVAEYEADGPYVADGIVKDNVLYIGGFNTFSAWDIKNHKKIWEIKTDNYCQASPTIFEDDIVFGAWDTKLRSLNIHDGNLNWEWNEPSKRTFFSPGNVVPMVTKDKVIIVAPDRYITAFDRYTGKMLWRNNSHKFRESMGHSGENNTVYAKTMDGEVVAIDANAEKYKELWMVDTGFEYDHAPCIVIENNGMVYAGSRKGEIAAIDPETQQLIWRIKIGNSEVNGWTVDSDGNLYFTLIEGTVWKINR